MPSLRYKFVGNERHLSFDSIRNLVLHQLSAQDRRKAWRHLEKCPRCRSIYESLAKPERVIKRKTRNGTRPKVILGMLLLIGLTAWSVSWEQLKSYAHISGEDLSTIYSWGMKKIKGEDLAHPLPKLPDVAPTSEFQKSATKLLVEYIEPLTGTQKASTSKTALARESPSYGSKGKSLQGQFYDIQGVITANDEPLQGVTIMVPHSKTAQVSNQEGRYYIAVPENTDSLLFIYQGKHLAKSFDPRVERLNINLFIDSMRYPVTERPENSTELIADN